MSIGLSIIFSDSGIKRISPISFYYCFIIGSGFLSEFCGVGTYLAVTIFLAFCSGFANRLLLLTFFFCDDPAPTLDALFILGWEAFRFIFFVLADFYRPFFDLDLAIEGLLFRLFLSRLVLGNFLLDLFNPPCGLRDRLLDLLRFSLSLPAAFFSLLALMSALTPRFINKYIES